MILEFAQRGIIIQDMADSKQMLFAKNLICVCINSNEDADYQGLIYHQYADDPIEFDGMTDFLVKTEDLFDTWDFPQRGLAQRHFKKSTRDEVEYRKRNLEEKLPIEIIQESVGVRNVQNKKGKLGTFVIQVAFRQDATWQGHVIHQEENDKQDFVSALELVRIIDRAVSGK